ncbi:hypothetical protein VZT92_023462 [Zoarces viviparus]|uniref:Uncharacterized protein n=1 Tax=Zoarces viviparus TaxID=48416 RepID=A0AAW1E6L8_ZOAVI
MAAWCNELQINSVAGPQDSPYRAIMSTPVYQFVLPTKGTPKTGSPQTWVGTACFCKPPIAPRSTPTPFPR